MLIDGGPQGPLLVRRLGEELPFWDRRIDAVLATHAQLDHIGGLVEVLRRFEVGVLYLNGRVADSLAFEALVSEAAKQDVPVLNLVTGDQIELGGSARALVLYPDDELQVENANDAGLVLRLSYEDASFLFAADIEEVGALALLASGADVQADVLKVPHHGGASDMNPELFARVSPSIAVISAGRTNPFGHPDPETLEDLAGVPIFRTDMHGTVSMQTDGENIEVLTGP